MAKKVNVKIKDLVVVEVEFNGDKILAIEESVADKKYIAVNHVIQNIGLSEDQRKKQGRNIQTDIVLSRGVKVLSAKLGTQVREYVCIELEFLPLWLAKISITPDMMTHNPEAVENLIQYQLYAKDVLANHFLNKKKIKEEWNLTREVGKVDRKRMTASIDKNIPDSPNKRWCYPNYTNLVYEILFNKDAKQMKAERGMKTNDALRDSFEKDELKLVDEAETIVTALITLGFTYEEIRIQLKNKFQNKLTVG